MAYSIHIKWPDIEVGREIDASPELVWDLITNIRSWPGWGPSVRAVDCEDRWIHSDSSGRIGTLFGLWLPFKICRFEPGRYWDWEVGGIRATGHRVDPLQGHRCRLVFNVPVLAAPYVLVCLSALRRIHSEFD